MHIILTHEQADFDALASLLGAALLEEEAIPVLPRRMNRNVRAFVTLYGVELPFVDPRDLNGGPVERVTLVDTQSMVSIRGMGPETQVKVIDHHPPKENLPEGWELTYVDTGATTTALIEALRERNGAFTPVQATLLLLGIYEDTGSLTYTRTTPRDMRAAAYLLEQGASLEIASDFLNHPLSQEQQVIFGRLREKAEYYHIHGHTIVIAADDAQSVSEELSTIAHKLRDLLDPDALFLLILTRGGVQLIARSTSDNIDVAEIAAQFSGGGHERASAGLIRDRGLDEVRNELIKILPRFVKPAITVAQIMSHGPQVLAPTTPVEEAANRMRRYGYEGYPVVRDGKVIGLLTRRAVDRATAHKLTVTTSSLMEAGEYTVQPGDSIEDLQRVMTDSGWGQVPVVDPESGDIIGIVTRTDLLKTLTPSAKLPSRNNLAARLEAALPPARLGLLKLVGEITREQHQALYIVGGFVRDLLLERPSLDFDLVVEGDAISLAQALSRKYGGRITSHARFGTAKWHIGEIRTRLTQALETYLVFPEDGQGKRRRQELRPENLPESLDLVTARTEFYTHPTALPTVERGSIKLDLHRRDFTINTLALRLDGRHYGQLHDYWGGLNDIRHGLVRVLHSLSFVDDPTRMLRAVRFEQRFQFRIEDRTLELLKEARPLLARVSGDRIRHEFNHIFAEQHPSQILFRLDELDLLKHIHPALFWDELLAGRLKRLAEMDPDEEWDTLQKANPAEFKQDLSYCIWLLPLPVEEIRDVSKRFKLSADLYHAITGASRLWRDLPKLSSASPSQVVERLEEISPLAIYTVFISASGAGEREMLESYIQEWRKITPTINGHDLRRMGLPPGPIYRKILGTLRSAWLDGEITSPEEEKVFLEELLEEVK